MADAFLGDSFFQKHTIRFLCSQRQLCLYTFLNLHTANGFSRFVDRMNLVLGKEIIEHPRHFAVARFGVRLA
ncbi:hypothetical protein D3C86_2091390 [compost metagenome]